MSELNREQITDIAEQELERVATEAGITLEQLAPEMIQLYYFDVSPATTWRQAAEHFADFETSVCDFENEEQVIHSIEGLIFEVKERLT